MYDGGRCRRIATPQRSVQPVLGEEDVTGQLNLLQQLKTGKDEVL